MVPLPIAPPLTPSCPHARYAGTAALLTALQGAADPCAEELAAALAAAADQPLLASLLLQAQRDPSPRARRNALRVLGRFAEQPPESGAHAQFAAIQPTLRPLLGALLTDDTDPDLLADTIWLLDTALYPAPETQAALTVISADPRRDPALHDRAAAAVGRLIFAHVGLLTAADLAFITAGLDSADDGVVARAARTARLLRPAQLDQATAAAIDASLAEVWPRAHAAALAIAPPPAGVLAAAELARALDARSGGARALELQTALEDAALPQRQRGPWFDIRADLNASQLAEVAALLGQTRAVYADLLGPALAAPLLEDQHPRLHVLIFGTLERYRGYLAAFVDVPFAVDGIYREAQATLYTYQRSAAQSANTLAETLRHETTHYFAGRSVFPGEWNDSGYHDQPKGWSDEGLAELIAGAEFSGSAYSLPPRPRLISELCGRAALPPLLPLLERRAGYDRFGSFDYAAAWSFVGFLFTQRRSAARAIYAAYRAGTYRTADVAALAGSTTPTDLESAWHAALRAQCSLQQK